MSTNSTTTTNSEPSGFAAGFLLGLVVGGAGGYFLTTPQGRQLLKELSAEASTHLDSLQDNEVLHTILDKIQNLPNSTELVEVTKDQVHTLASRVADSTAPKKLPLARRLFHSGGSPLKP